MQTITISPKLHNAVKLSKAHALNGSSLDMKSFDSMISAMESKLLSIVINNKGKKEQDEPKLMWT